ncbi:TetR family transcriptional regulator [Litorimonas taeanensis]|uniref:TetR family transcriptional regulator n=1 Tax=Litorimonas taeanensis TaxID=568099 RepID=A0A420WJ12_9PROT|nr:TetR/AcrR family transcriptional regulator [Litorimonas taeanensis]RKQ70987.1 TetR family transcriptional regulator [Litorimonas taeanensis]
MPERSATKSKILATSLALFNNEGESNISSVDIASVIGISPGNLYYHYKGKDEIILALFEDFEEEIRQVLSAPINAPLNMADNWVYLYIIFEEIFDFRFFYRNQAELVGRIPTLRTKFANILALKERTALSLLSKLHSDGHLHFDEGEKQALAGRIAQHFTFWLQYHDLRYGTSPPKSLIDQGVFMTLVQITPYWKDEKGYAALLQEFAEDKV